MIDTSAAVEVALKSETDFINIRQMIIKQCCLISFMTIIAGDISLSKTLIMQEFIDLVM